MRARARTALMTTQMLHVVAAAAADGVAEILVEVIQQHVCDLLQSPI